MRGGVQCEAKVASLTQPPHSQSLDLYQIHSATLESGVLQDEAVLSKLQELKDSRGLRIGLSTSGVNQAKTLDVAIATGLFGGYT